MEMVKPTPIAFSFLFGCALFYKDPGIALLNNENLFLQTGFSVEIDQNLVAGCAGALEFPAQDFVEPGCWDQGRPG